MQYTKNMCSYISQGLIYFPFLYLLCDIVIYIYKVSDDTRGRFVRGIILPGHIRAIPLNLERMCFFCDVKGWGGGWISPQI